MAAFEILRNISRDFELELCQSISGELFNAKASEPFVETVSKKLRDLSLLNSKFRLLQAKILSVTPQVAEKSKCEGTIDEYGDMVMWKIIEQKVVKTLITSDAVKKLITTPNNLDPELIKRKEQITDQLMEYSKKESMLRDLEIALKKKEEELKGVREKWHSILPRLSESRRMPLEEFDYGPLYKKLKVLVDKMELMRSLINKLVTSRTHDYDWLTDPHSLLKAVEHARRPRSVQDYMIEIRE